MIGGMLKHWNVGIGLSVLALALQWGSVHAASKDATSLEEYKAALLDSFPGTGRGFNASTTAQADIGELITQLESMNPIPNPTAAENMDALDGFWTLLYTSNNELLALLALGEIPLVEVGEITQAINSSALTVENTVTINTPVSTSVFSAFASFEVDGPDRIKLTFEEGAIGVPEINTDVGLSLLMPRSDSIAPKWMVDPLQAASKQAIQQVADAMATQAHLNFPITSDSTDSFLLVTYLDDMLRISRTTAGEIYVLVKQDPDL